MQREVVSRSLTNSAAPSPMPSMLETIPKTPPVMSYNLGQVGSGSNAAIAVAASRAIGATLEMQQGRRTASLKASYEAVSKSVELTKELGLGREHTSARSAAQTVNAAENTVVTKSAGRSSKKSGGVRAAAQQLLQQQIMQLQPIAPPASDVAPPLEPLEIAGDDGVQATWQPDPNEPRYCICNDVSYGDMVGCDNEDCPIEWFHYGCVGLTQAPRGKWYCPQCLAAMKRRGRK
jgi:inhibitor of growth protein 3